MEISPGSNTDRKIGFITSLGFLFGLSVALVAYLGSSYFKEATGVENVAIFFVISFSFILLGLFNLHKIFVKFGRPRTLLILLVMQIFVVFFLSIIPVSPLGAFFLILYYIIYGIIWVVWDAVLEAYSADAKTGRIRGMFLSVWGIGAIIGPLLSLTLVEQFGYSLIFSIVLGLYSLMLVVALITLNQITGKINTKRVPLSDMINRVRKTKALWQVYWVAISLSFCAATMVVFIPLKLRELGFEWSEMGLIFTIMLLPFVLLEYPAGVLADKKYGEKEIMLAGFVILIVAVSCITFLNEKSFVLWTSVLLLSRVGYALIEAMRDTYFYKQIDGTDVALINLFRTARPVAYILAMTLATIMQMLFGMMAVFIGLVVVLLISLYPVCVLKDTQPQG